MHESLFEQKTKHYRQTSLARVSLLSIPTLSCTRNDSEFQINTK